MKETYISLVHSKDRTLGMAILWSRGSTLGEIGSLFGVSRQRVQQILDDASEVAGVTRIKQGAKTKKIPPRFLRGDVGVIVLKDGMEAIVDPEDIEMVSGLIWNARRSHTKSRDVYYAYCGSEVMHRIIMGLEKGDKRVVDHINGNGLDNRRSNLRICTTQQNVRSMRKWRGKSKYKGVILLKNGKFRATIVVDGKGVWQGDWDVEAHAAAAYDEAAREYFGEFALLNFPLVQAA